MITKQYKKWISSVLFAGNYVASGPSPTTTVIPMRDIGDRLIYVFPPMYDRTINNYVFPTAYDGVGNTLVTTNSFDATYSRGVIIGSGNRPASEDDVWLQQPIFLSGSQSGQVTDSDVIRTSDFGVGRKFIIRITNGGSSDIVINEIGYQQRLRGSRVSNISNKEIADNRNIYSTFLFDRTVLDTPIVITPGETSIFEYEIASDIGKAKYINGVKMADWAFGSDNDVADVIDAAHNGLINLQTDAGWEVGDVRTIYLPAFTDGNGTSHASQKVGLVISSFENYNNCGNVLQFDFLNSLVEYSLVGTSSSYGYGNSYVYSKIMPSIVEQLPAWLKNRLLSFDVVSGRYSGSSLVYDTVSNNKLAPRAMNEINPEASCAITSEGSPVALYNGRSNSYYRLKDNSFIYVSPESYFCRTPYSSSYRFSLINSSGGASSCSGNSNTYYAPFGCL